MIYTGFQKHRKEYKKRDFVIISIGWGVDHRYPYDYKIPELCPPYDLQYNLDKEKYFSEVLSKMNTEELINKINRMSKGRSVVLVTLRRNYDLCHRQYVAEWLNDLGIECEEISDDIRQKRLFV